MSNGHKNSFKAPVELKFCIFDTTFDGESTFSLHVLEILTCHCDIEVASNEI